ncbi:hypothetical protein HF324_25700 [Chitinophaga oryzae]|uniref:Carboxypeptidase regulatory-like domain-containing protein n=1 Tax=Chitinophaga oryzae TaxID=2725414 RepID=A0ABX6LLX3_9BACT|nr:hypothetical protein [Chitinophaga oryzae]QJB41053.1 hypothetical protein HF324_25700 [Chitinophaga oryzae]
MFSFSRKSIVIAAAMLLAAVSGSAQEQGKFDPKLLKSGNYKLACYKVQDGNETLIGTFAIGVNTSGDKFSLTTTTAFHGMDLWNDTAVSNLNTFQPIYRASHNDMREMVLHFGNDITGYHIDKKTGKKRQVKEAGDRPFVDSYTYPFILSLLPLKSGYQTDFPVYDYKPSNKNNVKTAVVKEVKNNVYKTLHSGSRDVWEVTVEEPSTGEKSISYIDKKSRRLWQVDIFTSGLQVRMIDTESDANTIKAPFDKAATLKMITGGKAIISGQAFARDHDQGRQLLSKIQVINIQAKQVAPKGTQVVLIPYNDYFKEWVKVNESQRKKGREGIALSEEAAACIKTTTVYDDAGHFEFVNLMPGEYLLFTEFSFVHTYSQTEVVGYTDHYINGMFQYSSANTVNNSYSTGAGASIQKVVTVSKPGEKVEVKLKKTKQ